LVPGKTGENSLIGLSRLRAAIAVHGCEELPRKHISVFASAIHR
jgi:hypothetical protein